MTNFPCKDQPDNTIPEDTIVAARVNEVKLEHVTFTKDGKEDSFDKLIWWFEILDDGPNGTWKGRKIRGQTTANLTNHPNNRFRAWAEALLNRDIGVGFVLDSDDLVGTNCKITVRHEPDRRDPKTKWERVDEVLPGGGFDDNPPF